MSVQQETRFPPLQESKKQGRRLYFCNQPNFFCVYMWVTLLNVTVPVLVVLLQIIVICEEMALLLMIARVFSISLLNKYRIKLCFYSADEIICSICHCSQFIINYVFHRFSSGNTRVNGESEKLVLLQPITMPRGAALMKQLHVSNNIKHENLLYFLAYNV